jgi:hypothetical protein
LFLTWIRNKAEIKGPKEREGGKGETGQESRKGKGRNKRKKKTDTRK